MCKYKEKKMNTFISGDIETFSEDEHNNDDSD